MKTTFGQKIMSYLTNSDMFGHCIEFNFDRKGSDFKTPIGGTFSLIIKIIINTYIGMNFYNMVTTGNNENSNQTTLENYDQSDERIYLKETDMTLFYAVRHQRTFATPFLTDDVDRYIDYYF